METEQLPIFTFSDMRELTGDSNPMDSSHDLIYTVYGDGLELTLIPLDGVEKAINRTNDVVCDICGHEEADFNVYEGFISEEHSLEVDPDMSLCYGCLGFIGSNSKDDDIPQFMKEQYGKDSRQGLFGGQRPN